jgi:ribosomal protein S20
MARTDSNLKQVAGRDLTPAEQSMVDQIRTYLRQAKAANESGDVSRAHTLAHKAQLLSSELARK